MTGESDATGAYVRCNQGDEMRESEISSRARRARRARRVRPWSSVLIAAVTLLSTPACESPQEQDTITEVSRSAQALSGTVALDATADTFIYASTPFTNFGASYDLTVKNALLDPVKAAIVRFDEAEIEAQLQPGEPFTATLELTIQGFVPVEWGATTVGAYRMTMPWVEGGATWVCANDTDHGFFGALFNNCAVSDRWGMEWWNWDPLPYDPVPTDASTLTWLQAGTISFDVTADVQRVVNGEDHDGWMIVPDSSPSVLWNAFTSRESGTPPRLILKSELPDLCPSDSSKTDPGSCGCGNPETGDADGDGVLDCVDGCPNDPAKVRSETCGCGVAETDTDGDNVPDCVDECADDPSKSVGPCPPDPACTTQFFNNFEYFFCPGPLDWDQANMACKNAGYELARIDAVDEEAFLKTHLAGASSWVGGTDVASDGEWVWEFGGSQFWSQTSGSSPGPYVNWQSGQPDGASTENCLRLPTAGGWDDADCSAGEPFVCEQAYDECPGDPFKTRVGLCGCGEPDTDADGDGFPICEDDCDLDPNRVTLGQCGCIGEPFPRPAGTVCDDGFGCPGTCDGAGSCGSPALAHCVPSTQPPRGCQPMVHDNHAYLFCTDDVTPADARTHCVAAGMDLVRIDDADEDMFVAANLSESSWIGAQDAAFETRWSWTDGEVLFWQGGATGMAVLGQYSNWDPGEPTASTPADDCAVYAVDTGGTPTGWDARDCGTAHGFVCEVVDQCPGDAAKEKPGVCDCGTTDHVVQVDGRDVIVCTDECPNDPSKVVPGKCGCGVPESLCPLECPDNLSDPASPVFGKLQAGDCGCDTPDIDADGNNIADCLEVIPQCGTPGSPAPAGTPCDDNICRQTGPTVCDGAGFCGDVTCAPTGGGACVARMFRDHVYWFCDGPRTRAEAETVCGQDEGRYLVNIDDEVENTFVRANIASDSWTGGNQLTITGRWDWANASFPNAEPFWDGDANGGPHRNDAYADWQSGAPAGGTFAVVAAGTGAGGSWRDESGGAFGFVCEKALPRPPVTITTAIPTCFAEYLGLGSCPPVGTEQCVPADQVFTVPFPGGSSQDMDVIACQDKCVGLPDEQRCRDACKAVRDCHDACDSATSETECRDACNAQGIVPPAAGGTCNDTSGAAEIGELCRIESPYIDPVTNDAVSCVRTDDPQEGCTDASLPPGLVCGLYRTCVKSDGSCPGPVFPQPDVPLTSGGRTGTVRVCGVPSGTCLAAPDSGPSDCDSTALICAPPENVQTVEGLVFPQGAPVPPSPEELFDEDPLPEPDLTQRYPDKSTPCAGNCADDPTTAGVNNPFCRDPGSEEGEVENRLDPERNHAMGMNQNAPGSADIIDFVVDPRLDLDYRAELGPMGLPDVGVTAAAGLLVKAQFKGGPLPFNEEISIVDVRAEATADPCSISAQGSRVRLFGYDFVPSTSLLNIESTDCREAFAEFESRANRTTKAMRDAATLLLQYKAAQGAGGRLDLSPLCAAGAVFDDPPFDYPLPVNCEDQPPESHINELINYYEDRVLDLVGATGGLIAGISDKDVPLFQTQSGQEEFTLFTANFLVGPIPVTLEAFVGASYQIALSADYAINPGKAIAILVNGQGRRVDPNIRYELIKVALNGGPGAQAFLGFFAGAGFDFGPVAASIGIEARLTLGGIGAEVNGAAGLFMSAQKDPRPVSADVAAVVRTDPAATEPPAPSGQNSLIEPVVYKLKLGYSAGLSATIADILSGEVNARLKLKFFFFSKIYRQQLLKFDGFCSPACEIPILTLGQEESLADFPWATIRLQQLLPKLEYLPFVPEPDPATAPPMVGVDMGQLENLFYERLCGCVDPGDPCQSNGDCCDGLTCADDGTGAKTCGCRNAGQTCGAYDDCCGGGCNAGVCGCLGTNAACATDSDCCSSNCDDGECGAPLVQ